MVNQHLNQQTKQTFSFTFHFAKPSWDTVLTVISAKFRMAGWVQLEDEPATILEKLQQFAKFVY